MNVRKAIKNKMFNSDNGQINFYKIRRIREKVALLTLSDIQYIKKTYKERFGYNIDLKAPKTLQEKLNWLKLFYRQEEMKICSDKFEIRKYLENQGLSYLCNELVGVYNNANDIDYFSLPKKFVAKATHGSGWNLLCENKEELNWKKSVELMNSWLKLNLYVFGREWNYKEIKPRIIIEKFIEYKPLIDYKYMCYNGKPMYMQINSDFDGKHYVDIYRLKDWNHIPISYGPFKCSNIDLEKPKQYLKMYKLAEQLSKPFPFVRVDFYNFENSIILGELTFFPSGGMWPFTPRELGKYYDIELGEDLVLPEPNYNLELYKQLI